MMNGSVIQSMEFNIFSMQINHDFSSYFVCRGMQTRRDVSVRAQSNKEYQKEELFFEEISTFKFIAAAIKL